VPLNATVPLGGMAVPGHRDRHRCRRVVGYAPADHLGTELVSAALANVLAARDPDPGVISHSDRGCQYTSREFAALAAGSGVTQSLGRTGECWDNALPSRFWPRSKAS
jgi:putative transposase